MAALKKKYEEKEQNSTQLPAVVTVFQSLSMKKSVALFSKTDILLGPHGAGLSNALFMQPGRGVVEFLPSRNDVNGCYMYLAMKLGLRYHAWSDPKAMQSSRMRVNVFKIISIVEELIEELVVEGLQEREGGGDF